MARRFTPDSAAAFKRKLVLKMAEAAARKALFQIPSKTLQKSLDIEFIGENGIGTEAALVIPQYWAAYLHDGRGPVTPQTAKVLVWFQNIENDPRVRGGRGYPVTRDDIKRLTRNAYQRGLRENARRREAGLEPYMIVTKRAGPAKGAHFFTDGMVGFDAEISPLVLREFDAYIRQFVPSETLPAVAKLR